MNENLAERLATINEQIRRAASAADRDPDSVNLVAVSKTHPVSTIRAAIAAGARIFGENRVQEAEAKILDIGRDVAEWHLIGHLQSNKARKAVSLFDVIHSLDSLELARRLERLCEETDRAELRVFVQVDIAGESTKNGIAPDELPALMEFLGSCKRLKAVGLMIVPPFFDDKELVRPFFRQLREMRDEFLPDGELSMGMSHDFDVAIEEGSTHVRVGTAIFGERDYSE